MFSRMKYRFKMLSFLLPHATRVKRYFVILMILTALSTVLMFATPIFYKIFIDDVILCSMFSKMWVVITGYLAVYIAGVIIGYMNYWVSYALVNTTMLNVRSKILHNFFVLPFANYETMKIGDMKLRIDDDTNQIYSFYGRQAIDYFFSYITLFVSVGILFYIEWRLAIFSIIAIPLTFWLDHITSKHEKVINNMSRENDENIATWLHAFLQGWREIKALNIAKHETRRYYHYLHNNMICNSKWINYWTARVLVIPKIKDEFFMRFGLYLFGGLIIIRGNLKISDLLIFAMYYELLANAVKTVSSTDADLQSNMPFTDRLMESLETPKNNDSITGIIPDKSNIITFHEVSFTYPNTEKEVLHDISLTISKGERVAITGKSGCGKTTLLKLLTGIIHPTSGNVSFSGIDLNDIDLEEMHNRFGFVMQENVLFNTSIRENLLYGKQDAKDDEIYEACKKAYILDFIDSLPEGLDTVIGEKGIKISGGQKQRLVLARLFLRDVDIYILDEATSALDQYSENIVQDVLYNIAKDKTIIIVSHRESSIQLCNRRIILDNTIVMECSIDK